MIMTMNCIDDSSNEEVPDVVITVRNFSQRIEDLVERKPMPYMDAILQVVEDTGIEIEAAAKLINRNIKEQLEFQSQELNLLQDNSPSRLPI